MELPQESRERLLERLRAFRIDLEGRIQLLETGQAEVRIRHEDAFVDATQTVLASLYRQYGDLGALISEVSTDRL